MNGIGYLTTVLLVLALCWLLEKNRHASRGPNAEKASGVHPGVSPTEGAVVSRPTLLDDMPYQNDKTDGSWMGMQRTESAPADDQSIALSTLTVRGHELPPGLMKGQVESGDSTFIYRWVRPERGRAMLAAGWELEHTDPRYGTWLVRKEERWP
jgi:hypothetical protein